MIEVLSIAGYATIQDFGRKGTRKLGIPPGGHMDRQSARQANELLENDLDCALIELFGGHMTIEVSTNQWLSFSGGRSLVTVGSESYFSPCRIEVRPDAVVNIGVIENGNIVYVAAKNGFDVGEDYGSKSTYTPSKLGPNQGSSLQAGDQIKTDAFNATYLASEEIPQEVYFPKNLTVRVFAGPEYDLLERSGKLSFFRETFQIEKVNRIGYRLSGPEVPLYPAVLTSRFVSRGTIQLPIGGQPIILMSDAQTTGGYPRIAQLTELDIDRVSQLKTGSRIRFQLV